MTKQRRGEFDLAPTMRSPADEPGPRANRTIAKILDAARSVFLTNGYAGTTIDDLARVAGISRASFYTYFPTKRDALLALGTESALASEVVVDDFVALDDPWTEADLVNFVDAYFDMLDDHASFALVWTQAAHGDEEIRAAGMKGHLAICRRFGVAVAELRGRPFDDPTAFGLSFFALCERSWDYGHLYDDRLDLNSVKAEVTRILSLALER